MKSLLVKFLRRSDTQEEQLRAFELGAIQRLLLTFHFAGDVFFDTVGKVLGDLALGAPEQKWTDPRGQTPASERVFLLAVAAGELGAIPEHSRHGKSKVAPRVEQTIFNGRPR